MSPYSSQNYKLLILLSPSCSGGENHKSPSEVEGVLTYGLTMDWNNFNSLCTQIKRRSIKEREFLHKNHSSFSVLKLLLPKALEHSEYCIISVGSTFEVFCKRPTQVCIKWVNRIHFGNRTPQFNIFFLPLTLLIGHKLTGETNNVRS